MPVLLVVGEHDETTPLTHQKILYERLPGPKELRVIKGCGHTPRDPHHVTELKQIFLDWIRTL